MIKIETVSLEGGTFTMGGNRNEDTCPKHEVTLSPFAMGKYQVTQAQWWAVAELLRVEINLNPDPSYFKGGTLPVELVNWFECVEFCKRLSAATGETYRLPTEAEWEYACRAGSTKRYCFGRSAKQLADYAWYGGNSQGRTHPVGEKQSNALGLYDMHGNVWEWCADWYDADYYQHSPKENPQGQEVGRHKVLRGGSWLIDGRYCRSAYRNWFGAGLRNFNLGFRVVRVVRPPSLEV